MTTEQHLVTLARDPAKSPTGRNGERRIEIITPEEAKEEERDTRLPAQLFETKGVPDRNGFEFANDEITGGPCEPATRPLGALSPQCPDDKDIWLAGGFVMADAEIVASFHYITCPPIIRRCGFRWRLPPEHLRSRKNKETRGIQEKRAA